MARRGGAVTAWRFSVPSPRACGEKGRSTPAAELRHVRRRRIRMLLHRALVGDDRLQCGIEDPGKQEGNVQLLARIHLDVEDLRIAVHLAAGRFQPAEALRSLTGRMDVAVADAPLLPAHGDQVGPDERQQLLSMPTALLPDE